MIYYMVKFNGVSSKIRNTIGRESDQVLGRALLKIDDAFIRSLLRGHTNSVLLGDIYFFLYETNIIHNS